MSIKTIKQRISVASIVALAAGLLTVIAVPSASAGNMAVTAATAGTSGTSAACLTSAATSSTSPKYMAVGTTQAFTLANTPNATATATITGPAIWVDGFVTASGVKAHSWNTTAKVLDIDATASTTAQMRFTGVGQVTVSFQDDQLQPTFYFIGVTSCDGSVSLADSYFQLRDDTGAADSNINESGGSVVGYSTTGTQKSYIAMDLNDAYTVAVDTTSLALTATATGGCTVSWDATAATGTTIAVDTGANNDTENLVILNDNTPRNCSVTVTLGTTTIGTKTVSFRGDVAKITISPADSKSLFAYNEAGSSSETALNANAIVYITYDSAGNVITPSAAPTLTSNTNGFEQATITGSGLYPHTSMISNGFAAFDISTTGVSASRRGEGTYALKLTRQSDGQSVTSNVMTASITDDIWTFEASWDKAEYKTGEIMTLTITGKDVGGRLTYDGEDLAGVVVAVGGADSTVTPSASDTFSKGKKVYKYIAKTTAGNYGWSVAVTTGSAMDNIVGTYKIVEATTTVTNTEVLAAIVKLIASINKQIRALQKSLR